MSKQMLVHAHNYLKENSDSIKIDNIIILLRHAKGNYSEPEEPIKHRLELILDYICKQAHEPNPNLEAIQWFAEDIKHFFDNDLRKDPMTKNYIYNSLAPETWHGLDRKQWDSFIMPELTLPPKVVEPPPSPERKPTPVQQKWVPPHLRNSTPNPVETPNQGASSQKAVKFAALRAKYGG